MNSEGHMLRDAIARLDRVHHARRHKKYVACTHVYDLLRFRLRREWRQLARIARIRLTVELPDLFAPDLDGDRVLKVVVKLQPRTLRRGDVEVHERFALQYLAEQP